MFAFGETFTRLRAPLVSDPYSVEDIRAEWDDEDNPPDELDIEDCAFDPGGSDEPVEAGRQAVITKPTVFAPFGSDIEAADRLIVRGKTYSVEGNPGDYRSPFTGWEPGRVVELKLVEG